MTDDDRKFAIEDARVRHAALVDLIKFNDQKSITLLSLYITLGVATVGYASTYFGSEPPIAGFVAAGALGAAASLFVGSIFCFRTMKTVALTLPGRGYDFWDAAFSSSTLTFVEVTNDYVLRALETQAILRKVNAASANDLRSAKFFGLASPVIALIVGAGAAYLG